MLLFSVLYEISISSRQNRSFRQVNRPYRSSSESRLIIFVIFSFNPSFIFLINCGLPQTSFFFFVLRTKYPISSERFLKLFLSSCFKSSITIKYQNHLTLSSILFPSGLHTQKGLKPAGQKPLAIHFFLSYPLVKRRKEQLKTMWFFNASASFAVSYPFRPLSS